MRIVTVRRISQTFFLTLFLWFCVASSLGIEWWRLRGWPISWFLHLDPLVALGTLLTTQSLYRDCLWALATVTITVLLGRFFCSWVCPFGSMHHLVGYLGRRAKPVSVQRSLNRFRPAQSVKYSILIVLLAAAAGALLARFARIGLSGPMPAVGLVAVSLMAAFFAAKKTTKRSARITSAIIALTGVWAALASLYAVDRMIGATLQTGLLDPIPLVYRSVNLVLLPLADSGLLKISVSQRFYEGAWLIGSIFVTAILLNLKIPRFYCRFVCPLGALFGVLGKYALWRVGRTSAGCTECGLCEAHCEGGCEPLGTIRVNECVLCMNCLDDCRHQCITYSTRPSASGEYSSPDLSRRRFTVAVASGVAAVPLMRLGGHLESNWNPEIIRPPGALAEADFLARCLKCGQCMRVCPTNIIQPAGLESGIEGLWTPRLNFRIGTSGCQLNCVACGHVCPTAAIRPISLPEKRGLLEYAALGPIRLGMAFVDRGRCLPWAMDKPCIVCQENCPVSPKAIFVHEVFETVRGGIVHVAKTSESSIDLRKATLKAAQFATGDYHLRIVADGMEKRYLIGANTDHTISLPDGRRFDEALPIGSAVEIQVRLQRPQVDPERCIGCGVCEHECPVTGRRAIRVTAENESRSRKRSLLL